MKGNTPSSANVSQKPRGFGISNGNCCGPPLLEYTEWHMEKNTIQIFQNCTVYRFLCMILVCSSCMWGIGKTGIIFSVQ